MIGGLPRSDESKHYGDHNRCGTPHQRRSEGRESHVPSSIDRSEEHPEHKCASYYPSTTHQEGAEDWDQDAPSFAKGFS